MAISQSASTAFVELAARVFPYRPDPDLACDLSLDELAAQYRKWETGSSIPFVILSPALTWLWHGFFVDLQSLAFRSVDPGVFLLEPHPVVWWIPAMMLGILSSLLPMHVLYSYLLGSKRYAEYTHYVNLRVGADGWRAMRWFGGFVTLCCAAIVPLILGYYTRFSHDSISVHGAFSGERNYRYSDIDELRWKAGYSRQGNRGKVTVQPEMEIAFRDGYCWSGHSPLFETPESKQREIIKFVSERSGQPIVEYARTPK